MRQLHDSWRRSIRAGALALAMLSIEGTTTWAEDAKSPESPTPAVEEARRPRGPRLAWPSANASNRRPDGGWSTLAFVALALAAGGGIAIASRRASQRGAAGAMQVVGRVGLSPKHSVYLLRIGRRVLVVGAGPQGPPSLIAELDDVPEESRTTQEGAEPR